MLIPNSTFSPTWSDGRVSLYCGELEDLLPELIASGLKADAFIVDPPYCSGGATARERTGGSPEKKYVFSGVKLDRPDFAGDQRDQRALGLWAERWLRLFLRAARSRCYVASFIDKRNLSTLIDSVQVAGWRYSDLLPWDKGMGVRPMKGWFRGSQAEYVVVGTVGSLGRDAARHGPCLPGVLRCTRKAADLKAHMHAKPVELLQTLLGPLTGPGHEDRLAVDTFAGSGSTLLAAQALGLRAIGFEKSPENCAIAAKRLDAQAAGQALFRTPPHAN